MFSHPLVASLNDPTRVVLFVLLYTIILVNKTVTLKKAKIPLLYISS